MLFFRYKWIPVFSRGLCIMLIRGGDKIKELSDKSNGLFKMPINAKTGKEIVKCLIEMTNTLDYMIFSVGALLYREEKDLIEFSERVEDAAERWMKKIRREKAEYEMDAKRLEEMIRDLKKKKEMPLKFKRKVEKEKAAIEEDDKRKREMLELLHKITAFIKDADARIYDIRLEAKAQNRDVINLYTLEEGLTIRSMTRLGRVTKGKGINVGSLVKGIRKKLHYFSRIAGTKTEIDKNEVDKLLKLCRIELDDLRNLFLLIMQTARKAHGRLNRLESIVLNNNKLLALKKDINAVKKRLGTLREDIQTQYKRLSNEFKKGRFTVDARVKQEIQVVT